MNEKSEYSVLYERKFKSGSMALMQIRVVVDEEDITNFTEKQTRAITETAKARLRIRNGKRIIEVFNSRGTFKRVRENASKGNTLEAIRADLKEVLQPSNTNIANIKEYVMEKFREVASQQERNQIEDFKEHFTSLRETTNEGTTTADEGVYLYINYAEVDPKGKTRKPYVQRKWKL